MPGKLFIGPLVGEFGHELLYAGVARAMADKYDETTVCTRPGREVIHKDYAKHVTTHTIVCEGMCMSGYKKNPGNFIHVDELKAYWPGNGCHAELASEYYGRKHTRFVRYGRPQEKYKGFIVLHARTRGHCNERNWSAANWNRLARWLIRCGYDDLACVGTVKGAMSVEGCLDMRAVSLQGQMDLLASARCAIGMSSGPLHLASLCGCPHLVWCGGPKGEYTITRQRYAKAWNPHGTFARTHACGSWQPKLERVRDWTAAFLKELPS